MKQIHKQDDRARCKKRLTTPRTWGPKEWKHVQSIGPNGRRWAQATNVTVDACMTGTGLRLLTDEQTSLAWKTETGTCFYVHIKDDRRPLFEKVPRCGQEAVWSDVAVT
jgi:hypothetical protein